MNRAAAAGIAVLALAAILALFLGPCADTPEAPRAEAAAIVPTSPAVAPESPQKSRARDPGAATAADETGDDGERREFRVRVVAAGTKGPVSGASVEIDDRVFVTGADGEAAIGDLLRSTYSVGVRARGFVYHLTRRSLPDDGDCCVIELATGVTLAIEVVEAGTGLPIGNASVAFGDMNSRPRNVVVTDARGVSEVVLAPQADVRACTSASRHVSAVDFLRTVALGASQAPLRVELPRSGTVRGVVTAPDGSPVCETDVMALRTTDEYEFAETQTDANGRYELDVPFGVALTVVADSPSTDLARSAASRQFTAEAGRPPVVVDLRLRKRAALDITIVDDEEEGRVAEGLHLLLRAADGSSSSIGTGGNWQESLCPGRIRLEVRHEDRVPIVETIDVLEGETLKRTLHLTAGARISGIVVDEAGDPVAGAFVETTESAADGNGACATKCGEDGRFALAYLPEGTHDLVVDAPYEFEGTVVRGVAAPSEGARFVVRRRGTLSLRAVFDGDAKPAPDARIAFRGTLDGKEWRIDRYLERDGHFEESWPARASGEVEVRVDGFLPVTRGISVPLGASVDLGEIRFRRAAALSGWLVDAGGNRLVGRTLFIRGGWREDSSLTNDAGFFTLTGLAPGTVRIDLDTVPSCGFAATVPSSAPVQFVLPETGTLALIWRDASSVPVVRGKFVVRDAAGVTCEEDTTGLCGDGTCTLAPGKFTVSGEGGPSAEFEIRSGVTTFVRLR